MPPSWTGCSTCSLQSPTLSPFQDGPPPVVKPSLIEAPIMDRLLNLFSAVSNSVSISGWPSPGGENLSNRGPYHGQAAQPVLYSLHFRMALPRW
ncbi:hypothetical protein DPMN_147210 [Dreissena polymorpha]|uniref:Uncharacterized protein n=1 Tax=Dreissena polymorpha TaxID=45954 RepID=A0A9D4F8L5_DREPO|nr:hypothetical protein DPMN_147210 [Dreissena polymorpha]